MSFESALKRVSQIEAGYSDHPADRGGPTNFGVTERNARAHGYSGDMRDMPREFAELVYQHTFWVPLRLDHIDRASPALAEEIFEGAVNFGPQRAAAFFQRALNVFNKRAGLFADVIVDGSIGPITIKAFNAFCMTRGLEGLKVLHAALNALQGAYYISLAEADPTQEDFVYGWVRQRVAFSV